MITGFRRRSAAASLMVIILLAAIAVLGATAGPALAAAGDTTRVSVDVGGNQGNGQTFDHSISGNGRYVAFSSDASNLVPADTNAAADVFVHDRQTGAIERVNVDGSGNQANDFGAAPSISADGRFVAFFSRASNLVAGDTNGRTDVFVHDRQTGTTERVSVDGSGNQSNHESFESSISADGRFVAFHSHASNLVVSDTNLREDIFVHDRQTGTTERVSVDSAGAQGNESSLAPSISADGRLVAFYSNASNLVGADTNAAADIFVHDRQTGTTERVSVDGSGNEANRQSLLPSISAGGRFAAFQSDASNLVTGDTNSATDVFVHDLQTGATERVSVDGNGNQANLGAQDPAISADGRFVAFPSAATNLVGGDTNATSDVFLRDRQFGTTERASVSGTGAEANGRSSLTSLSANGRVIAFLSSASNLVTGDTNAVTDVFVHELSTDVTRPSISITAPLNGSTVSGTIDVSADASDDVGIAGVQFKLDGANLGPEDTTAPYAVAWDTTTVANVSHRLSAVARDGAGNATTSEVVTVRVNNPLGATERVSVDSSGNEGNSFSTFSSISGDGRFAAFSSSANNLVAGDLNGQMDIFVHDRQTHATERVSVDGSGNGANSSSTLPSISADGRFVAFSSFASNLVPGDTNGAIDVFVHDRQTSAIERVSVDGSGIEANSESNWPSISADGRFVAFHSAASNLVAGDTNATIDIFVHDRQTGATERVSVDGSGNQANTLSQFSSISADGRFVAFTSFASNLVAGDTNSASDVFVHDRQTGATERVSVGDAGTQGNGSSPGNPPTKPSISADGRVVAFHSSASNLVVSDTNSASDVFVHDRQTGATARMSVGGSGNEGNGESQKPSISPDGRVVAFESGASNLVDGDTNAARDVFVHDRQTGATERVSVGGFGGQANGFSFAPSVSADGSFVAFSSSATNLTPGDNNAAEDVFVHELDTAPPSISITAPGDGSTVSGTTGVSAQASDNVQIAGVQFRLDGEDLGAEDVSAPYSIDWDTTSATNGTHTLTAVALDAAGNSTTSAVVSVTVSNDVSAPLVSIDSPPPNPTNDNTPTFAFSADEPATFQCSLSQGADSFESCESPKTYSAQIDGLYTFKVKATDDAGNTSEVIAYSFEIDATPPAAPSAPDLDAASDTGLSDSDNETSDVTPTFSGTAEAGSTVTILVDGIERGSGVASSTYSITTDALSLGDHVVVARAEDAAGNLSAQSGPLTVRIVDATCHAPNRIVGTERPNLLVGTMGADVMLGLGGTDALFGLGGADCLSGGAGDDILAGGSGDDESVGDTGRDYIDPGPGRDLVSGGSGDDTVDARDGAVDRIDCGAGTRDAATVDRIDQVIGCEKVSRGR